MYDNSKESDQVIIEDDLETEANSFRNSYVVDDVPLPLNYIVWLENTFEDEDHVNFIFEYLPGQDLYWFIKNKLNMELSKTWKVTVEERRRWIGFYSCQVLCALETLHKHKIVYRDIKPENIMIDKMGLVKLIDFGFSKLLLK
jgi:serine/threonine protein kinase